MNFFREGDSFCVTIYTGPNSLLLKLILDEERLSDPFVKQIPDGRYNVDISPHEVIQAVYSGFAEAAESSDLKLWPISIEFHTELPWSASAMLKRGAKAIAERLNSFGEDSFLRREE